ncbi:MAG TPA: 16S rRNA (cytosine(1402)-N(4))-methyltransferase, partial [Bradyrhizobium sp.]
MAAHQIPSGNQGLRLGTRGIGNRAAPCSFNRWLFDRKSPAKRRHLRRNGPVRFQYLFDRRDMFGDLFRGLGMNPHPPRHIPVLGREVVEMLKPGDGGIYLDATFGAGGYSRAILDFAGTRVIGIDRDRSAILAG